MKETLQQFLQKFHAHESPYTHVTYIGQKYNIPEKHQPQFHKLYYQAIKNNQTLYLIERTLDEFNFFQDIDSKNNQISTHDIKEIILNTTELLQPYTQQPITSITSKRNNNYHINYNVRLTQTQAIELTNKLKNNITSDLSTILDTNVYNNNGLRMLGSYDKKEQSTPYQLFDLDNNQPLELTFERFQQTLLKGTLTQSSTSKTPNISSKMNQLISEDITKLLYDLIHHEALKERIKDIEKLTKFNLTPEKIKCTKNKFTGLMNFYIIIKDRFCPFKLREHQRTSNPIYICLTHHGITLKCYDQECANKTFPNDPIQLPIDWPELNKMYPTLIKYLTIKYYSAEVDMTSETRDLIIKSLSCTHYSIAKVIFHLYKDTFRMDEMKNTEWYQFNGTRWEKTYKLHIFISEELPKYYRSLRVSQDEEENTTEDQIKYNQLIDKCITRFENNQFKKCVFEELKYLYYDLDSHFSSKLDSNPYLIGFNNGIYDLKQMTFRKSTLQDYITFNTHYDYKEYNPDCPTTKDIHKFLKEIIPNNAVREYTLKVLGRGLLGIPDEKFYLWTGIEGSNGKSTLINLLERTLGDYAISCDTSLLTNKRAGSSSATPDLFEMKGRRLICFQEPENTDRLRTGVMKQLTGGDTIKARELFKSLVSFKSQGTFVMCCNELPYINAVDGGTWRRIRVTDFISKFCDKPRLNHPHEFKIDPQLKEKMQDWCPYFMSILIHYYTKFKKEGNLEPKEVLQATNRYKMDNDKFDDYFKTCIHTQTQQFTPLKDIYENFSEWWIDEYPTEKIPSVLELKKALRIKYGDIIEGRHNNRLCKGFNITLKNHSFSTSLLDEN